MTLTISPKTVLVTFLFLVLSGVFGFAYYIQYQRTAILEQRFTAVFQYLGTVEERLVKLDAPLPKPEIKPEAKPETKPEVKDKK